MGFGDIFAKQDGKDRFNTSSAVKKGAIGKAFRGSTLVETNEWNRGNSGFVIDQNPSTKNSQSRAGFDQSKLSTIPKAAPTTPAVSHARMNQGGGPGQESPGADMVRDSFPGEHAQLFAKPKGAGPAVGPRPGLKDGVYLPMGGFGTGGMVNVGDVESRQAGALFGARNPNFTGQPTMYPAQQSVGKDIFGDTADLLKQRDSLRAQRDAFFAKNPLSPTDIGGNFAKAAMMSGNRRDLEDLNKTLNQREQIMGTLAGIMIGGQNQLAVQGLQNQGQLQNTQLAGQNMMGVQGLQNQGQLQNTQLAGQNMMAVQGLQNQGQLQNTALAGENQQRVAQIGEEGADRRAMLNSQTDLAKSAATGATEKDVMTAYTSLVQKLADPNIDPETRTKIQQDIDLLKKQISAFNIKGRQIAQ